VKYQRHNYNNQKLSANQIAKLTSLDFECSRKDRYQNQWEQMFQALIAYNKEHGDCLVPSRWKENTKLGKWVSKQRQHYNNQKLSVKQIAKLESIGFVWIVDPDKCKSISADDEEWEEFISGLKAYKRDYGTADVPRDCATHPDVALRVKNTRAYPKRLTPERRAQLDELEFTWLDADVVKREQEWERNFNELVAHKVKHDACLAKKPWECFLFANIPPNLHNWVKTQRKLFKEGDMSQERIAKLKSIDFLWSERGRHKGTTEKQDDKWFAKCDELVQFYDDHGHLHVPKSGDTRSLHGWIYCQRKLYKKGHMQDWRRERLEEMKFVWSFDDARTAQWHKMYNELKEVQKGTRAVDKSLQDWKYEQRRLYEKGTLDPERQGLLDKIDFDWNPRGREMSS
jgi:hypothetical protein